MKKNKRWYLSFHFVLFLLPAYLLFLPFPKTSIVTSSCGLERCHHSSFDVKEQKRDVDKWLRSGKACCEISSSRKMILQSKMTAEPCSDNGWFCACFLDLDRQTGKGNTYFYGTIWFLERWTSETSSSLRVFFFISGFDLHAREDFERFNRIN